MDVGSPQLYLKNKFPKVTLIFEGGCRHYFASILTPPAVVTLQDPQIRVWGDIYERRKPIPMRPFKLSTRNASIIRNVTSSTALVERMAKGFLVEPKSTAKTCG